MKQLHDHPTRAVTLLGEHLVAFRDRSGNYGLIQEFCPHRNTNLLWGIVEPEGLRCPYHGWLFDADGNCLEQPAEHPDSTFKDRIKVQSYPVEELGGMLYAWLGLRWHVIAVVAGGPFIPLAIWAFTYLRKHARRARRP